MGKALLLSSDVNAVSNALARFNTAASTVAMSGATESRSKVPVRTLGVFSKMAVRADNVGTGRSVKFRKNAANGTQTLSPTDTTSGVYEDASNTDTPSAGDLIDIQTTSTGTPTYYWFRLVFAATSNHACYYGSSGTDTVAASLTRFAPLAGNHTSALQTAATNVKCRLRAAGTLKNAYLSTSANSRSDSTTVNSNINGSNGTLAVAIGAGLTGTFEDVANSDAVNSGDDVCWAVTTGAGTGTITVFLVGGTVVNTVNAKNDIFASFSSGRARAASATADYYFIAGNLIAATSNLEANAKVQHGFAVVTTNLRLFLSANTYSGAATVTLRKNGGAGAQTFSIGAGLTGLFEDSTHADAFGATDDAAVEIVGGTSGSITMRWLGLTEMEQRPRAFGFLAG